MRAVADAGVRLQVGFMRRYDPAYLAASKRIEAGEIGEPVVFKSLGRDKDMPPLRAYQSRINGMLFYNSTIHDFDLARWLTHDEVAEVHAFATVAIRPEIAEFGDIVAGSVNLRFGRGAIGNIESYVQCLYGYDIRTEVVGSKGSILIGGLRQNSATFLKPNNGSYELEDHFLSRFREAYVAEVIDFVDTILSDRAPRVTGEDGLRAVEIAVAAEKSLRVAAPCKVWPNKVVFSRNQATLEEAFALWLFSGKRSGKRSAFRSFLGMTCEGFLPPPAEISVDSLVAGW